MQKAVKILYEIGKNFFTKVGIFCNYSAHEIREIREKKEKYE